MHLIIKVKDWFVGNPTKPGWYYSRLHDANRKPGEGGPTHVRVRWWDNKVWSIPVPPNVTPELAGKYAAMKCDPELLPFWAEVPAVIDVEAHEVATLAPTSVPVPFKLKAPE